MSIESKHSNNQVRKTTLKGNGSVSTDPVSLYLRDLNEESNGKLLSREAEVELAQAYQAGQQAHEFLEASNNITETERDQFNRIIQKGADAQKSLIEKNLRWVVNRAKRYLGQGLVLLDLIQMGNIGLMKAVERFDPERGNTLCTYATDWIDQEIERAIKDQSRTIRVPVHVQEAKTRIEQTQRELTMWLSRDPTNGEIAAAVDMDEEHVIEVLQSERDTVSFDECIQDPYSGHYKLPEKIPDRQASCPETLAVVDDTRRRITAALEQIYPDKKPNGLPDSRKSRNRALMIFLYGLGDNEQHHTDAEASREFGISRERAGQIRKNTMRNPIFQECLRECFPDVDFSIL